MATYAIISLGGKQYRVSEGQELLVDRLGAAEGEKLTPRVLFASGDDGGRVQPDDVVVTAVVVGEERGPKIRIGKYKRRTGYKRQTGFRAALSRIEIESIGAPKPARKRTKAAAEPSEPETTEES